MSKRNSTSEPAAKGSEANLEPQPSSSSPAINASSTADGSPEHVVLMVNGLFGTSDNWRVVQRNLAKLQQASKILMLASTVNLRLQTFEGIDACGDRLAEEVLQCIRSTPGLKYISVMGHSMGGLIARHAIGKLYDPQTGRIGGLQPRHFITLATPHLGCGGEGPAQVPFIGWTAEVPVVGPVANKAMQYWADSVASVLLGRTGQQFFFLDGTPDSPPLLLRMVEDGPDGHFYSALEAFVTRTCYANSSGDHIVGWANSSIRHPNELPDLEDADAMGVVREDALEAAFSLPRGRAGGNPEGSTSMARSGSKELAARVSAAEETQQSSEAVIQVLQRLQQLGWCRVDTSFKGSKFPYFAHNHIQVTREWLNWEGEAVVQHLVQKFADLETAAAKLGAEGD